MACPEGSMIFDPMFKSSINRVHFGGAERRFRNLCYIFGVPANGDFNQAARTRRLLATSLNPLRDEDPGRWRRVAPSTEFYYIEIRSSRIIQNAYNFNYLILAAEARRILSNPSSLNFRLYPRARRRRIAPPLKILSRFFVLPRAGRHGSRLDVALDFNTYAPSAPSSHQPRHQCTAAAAKIPTRYLEFPRAGFLQNPTLRVFELPDAISSQKSRRDASAQFNFKSAFATIPHSTCRRFPALQAPIGDSIGDAIVD
ncbi:hypothetical protein C8R43DRAFT_953648 [Mycena crocata]|nr:hypothetical protein C8R43DRAFT_965075 [Mycena crocata]KAJ7086584.1 hypothetical protein C8R43DRAFT_965078 [Mycena crocata]KAJ7144839.1 hypothetical protein C8R43DRAFT_953648 [Mycena crocata]